MTFTLKKQILALTIIPLLILTLIFSIVSLLSINTMGKDSIAAYRDSLLSLKKSALVNYTEIALEVIEQQSQEEAKATIRRLKYGENGYFWINDFNHFMVSHPDPSLNEQDQTDLHDPNGVYILREIVKTCREKGSGFVPYSWRKLQTDPLLPKLSYVTKIDKWNWILGTGLYVDDIDTMVAQEQQRTQQMISSLIVKNFLISCLILLSIAVGVAYFVNRHVNRPINHIIETLQHFDNDLTVQVPDHFKFEFGQLSRQFNQLIDQLHQIISQVSDATLEVTASVTQISATTEQQAAISSEQSASVSEITSTMEEFSATSKQIAEHCNAVVSIATAALGSARSGAEAVDTVMAKMKEINEDNQGNLREIVDLGKKSKEISKVMEIINNIADQTKLIAFNAAIEASSAGEAGKRFGVVAAEIRRLADNVMDSTEDIESKIQEIQESVNRIVIVSEKGSKQIHEGMECSSRTARQLGDIVNGANSTLSAAKQISLSTQQQETASDQVVLALKEIDEGARQTSSSIHHISEAAAGLKQLSENLKEIVDHFKLRSGRTGDGDRPRSSARMYRGVEIPVENDG